MTNDSVKRLGYILAIQAEIEGMKAENKQREILGDSLAYTEGDFLQKAGAIEYQASLLANKD